LSVDFVVVSGRLIPIEEILIVYSRTQKTNSYITRNVVGDKEIVQFRLGCLYMQGCVTQVQGVE